ncbi:MAG: class I SAM-dependent methyltransferase [Methylobacter sp.]|nr:class I SAM-dependent methyltransferase [Methylobacter sp.]
MIYLDNHISFGEDDKEALRILVREVLKPNSKIVEIGSWLGTGSTKVIIEELQAIGSGTLYCVDTWKGSENVAQHQEVAAHYDIFETFSHNVNLANGEAYVKPLMMSSKDAAAIIEDGSIDLVFIDGDHSYAAVTEDIALWKSKVREGGILCGHDCECRPNGVLRDAISSSLDLDYIPGAGTFFEVVHPGVVLAVDEAFSGSANLWAETPFSRPNGVHGRATLWDNQQLSTITGPSPRPPISHDTPLPHLVGAVSDYNIVLFAGVHYAAPQSLGALDLSQLDLASRPPEILVARSYDEIVLAITEVSEQEQPIPHLVGAVSGYNIVLFAGAHYALPQSLGPLDLSQLDLSSMPPAILIARSYDEIVLAITGGY